MLMFDWVVMVAVDGGVPRVVFLPSVALVPIFQVRKEFGSAVVDG
jgi:hypothetical protein